MYFYWKLFLLLFLAVRTSSIHPYRFQFIPPYHWIDGQPEPVVQKADHKQTQQNGGFCADLTKKILSEFDASPHFGWISAQGEMPLGKTNSTFLAVKCVALVLTSRDVLAERKCIRAILSVQQSRNLSMEFSQEGQNRQNVDFSIHENVSEGGEDRRPLIFLQLFTNNGHHKADASHFSPCIFPIGDRIAAGLTWNATVCGLSSERDNFVCTHLEFPINNGGENVTIDGFQKSNKMNHHFLPNSTLFLFFNKGQDQQQWPLLGGFGTAHSPMKFKLFGDQDCGTFSNSTDHRVQCLRREQRSAETSVNPAGLGMAQNASSNRPINSNSTTTVSPVETTTITTRGMSSESWTVVPLLVLSVLVLSGMLLTIGLFLVQKHQQIYYDTL